MAIEHVVEVQPIKNFRGKESGDLKFFHKNCHGGKVEMKKTNEGRPYLYCHGCCSTLIPLTSKKIREIIDLALKVDEDSEVTHELENKDKIVHFVLAPSE